ncbi:glycosyltransferase involved in cell wall biosynthesis [Pseudoduganella lurida]|uniref:Glycosyltransferase involved in cell wall biosynthesis n=1 Tax=Pseudoduganella lurida TaxID=1036180 RepID=A0A562R1C1_9BURK|nr:glycosyltransferase family 4 protein [Pseudoduganella lurida]TWI62176.1 glycosyltransferase involved in cell wall biosynthesis [Pseudoduganella lurida]
MCDFPRFAVLTIGSGGFLGSTVRDITLANALHQRGYAVSVYWMLETSGELVDDGIGQRMLCHGSRYHFRRPSLLLDRGLGPLLFLVPKARRVATVQRSAGYVHRLLEHLIGAQFGPRGEPDLARRLARYLKRDCITHLLLSFASLGPLALQARRHGGHAFDYLVTFQGDEQFAQYARTAGVFPAFRDGVNTALRASRWPAVAVSSDYVDRLVEELSLPRAAMQVVYNGVDLAATAAAPFAMLQQAFPGLREEVPIVLYLGRQDVEKGIDLLLYAVRLLAARQVPLQLVVCGSTALGQGYRNVLAAMGTHLGLQFHHGGAVSHALRQALYAHSHCVVYPSINREPFGLVVAEAMGQGTPVLVPDYGGVGEVIRDRKKAGGLTFRTWDSGDLARQLERLLSDRVLHATLARDARSVAQRFSVDAMTQGVLAHMQLAARPLAPGREALHVT